MQESEIISLGRKLTEKSIGDVVESIVSAYQGSSHEDTINIDGSDLEWVSNQGVLVLSALLKYIIFSDRRFYLTFLKRGSSEGLGSRRARPIVQLWEFWKIYEVIPSEEYKVYFDIDGNFVERARKRFGIQLQAQEIYDWYRITPIIALDYLDKYDDKILSKHLEKVFDLNQATIDVLASANLDLPFHNETLSLIVAKELYENFLDHFESNIFVSNNDFAFMSLALKWRHKSSKSYKTQSVQNILKSNFESEQFKEALDFFYDRNSRFYRDRAILELSLLDFGKGIPQTLKEDFEREYPNRSFSSESELDSAILKYAFSHTSSRHPIKDSFSARASLPRGLFDLISVVRRFQGMLFATSGFGKILFDFTENKSIDDAFKRILTDISFPGTLISIYIPEWQNWLQYDESSIKPYSDFDNYSFIKDSYRFVSFFEIHRKLIAAKIDKKELYNKLLEFLIRDIKTQRSSIIYFDFRGYDLDTRAAKKVIHFLISDHFVNLRNNVIVLNPPPPEFLDGIRDEVNTLRDVEKKFRYHPTPFVYSIPEIESIEVYWLGVFAENDIEKLNDLLLEEHDLRKTDFYEPEQVVGHLNYFDLHGNLKTVFRRQEVLNAYHRISDTSITDSVQKIVNRYIEREKESVFLCSGNYYQKEYILLFNALSNPSECDFLAESLWALLQRKLGNLEQYAFLAITESSQKLLASLVRSGKLDSKEIVPWDFDADEVFGSPFSGSLKRVRVILVCDVVSTGFMVGQVRKKVKQAGGVLDHVGVLVNAVDPDFQISGINYEDLFEMMTAVVDHPMNKKRRHQIRTSLASGELSVTRINPYTNTPIDLSIKNSNFSRSVLLGNKEFLEMLAEEHIKVGYFRFNHLIHSYFFDMHEILSNESFADKILKMVFSKIPKANLDGIEVVFYPKGAGICNGNIELLKQEVFHNHSIQAYELDRIATSEGWRFPHPAQYLWAATEGKNVLILDDGSCSGESIIQMIDEVAFIGVSRITVVSLIGRVSSYKREFFSRISTIKNAKGDSVEVAIYFGSHWHIPTYHIEENPISAEKSWVDSLLDFPNVPESIRKVAASVSKELNLKGIAEKNNEYLIRGRDGKSIYKKLVAYKQEIGKMTAFRFYREHFSFFDDFIRKYEGIENTPDRYEDVELVCGVLLHEPFLKNRLSKVLPDLIEKLKEFVVALMFGKEFDDLKKLSFDRLTYHWEIKNVIHLLFMLHENEELFKILNPSRVTNLLFSLCKTNSDVNYFLYRLLAYYQIDNTSFREVRFSGKINEIIDKVIVENSEHGEISKKLKRFRAFTATLEIESGSFRNSFRNVRLNYERINDDQFHRDGIRELHDILQSQFIGIINGGFNSKTAKLIESTWDEMRTFYGDLLRLSNGYPGFFAAIDPKILDRIENDDNSLRKSIGLIEEEIHELSDSSRFQFISELEQGIYDEFVGDETKWNKVFNTGGICNLGELVKKGFVEKIKERGYEVNFNDDSEGALIPIPEFVLYEIVFEQLLCNVSHIEKRKVVEVEISRYEDRIILAITTHQLAEENKRAFGSGRGLAILERLNQYPNKMISFKYRPEKASNRFFQIFSFDQA